MERIAKQRQKTTNIVEKGDRKLGNYINAETQTDETNKMCATSTLNVTREMRTTH